RDPRDDRAGLGGADVERQLEQLVGLGDALGAQHFGGAQLDLGEVVDRDLGRRRAGCSGGRRGGGGCRLGGDPLGDQRRLAVRLDARENRRWLGELATGPAPFRRPAFFVPLASELPKNFTR